MIFILLALAPSVDYYYFVIVIFTVISDRAHILFSTPARSCRVNKMKVLATMRLGVLLSLPVIASAQLRKYPDCIGKFAIIF